MKRCLLILIMFNLVAFAFGQVLTVRDAETNNPLELVNIIDQKTKKTRYTDTEGKIDIRDFLGSGKIDIRIFGYKSISKSYIELSDSDYTVSLTPNTINLQQAVVSATRWSQSRQEIPARITTISTEERELLNPQNAADLLGISGEVFIQKSQQGGGSPMIRGFSTNRLLYTVDGVRMNTAIFRSGNHHNVISLDPFATESTEIFFGPGSIIYGSDAIGAVMSFQTLQPVLSQGEKPLVTGSAVIRANSANEEKTGHVHLKYGGKKWAGVTSLSRYSFGELKMGSWGPEEFLRPVFVEVLEGKDILVENNNPKIQNPTEYEQFNILQKIQFSPNNKWDFQYAFHYSETSTFSRYDRLIRFRPNGQPRSAEWKYGPQIWIMNHLKVSHSSKGNLYDKMSLNLAHQKFVESRIDRNFNDVTRRTRIEKVDAYSANLDFLKNFDPQSTLFYGLEWVFNNVTSVGFDENIQTGQSSQGPARYPDSKWNSYAIYTTYQQKVTPKSMLQAGMRYNRFGLDADFSNNTEYYPFPFEKNINNEGALTASTGGVFHPTDSWTMHVSASTGFRAPNVDDIGKVFDSEPGTVMVPNPELKAEYAYNLELNVEKVFNDKVMIDLTSYYTYLNNALVRREFTLNGQDSIIYDGELSRVLSLVNASFVRIIGLQAALEIKLPYQLTFSSRLNIQKGVEEVEDGTQNPSRHAPPTFGVSRLEYKREKYRIQLFFEYSGGFKFDQLPLEERGKPELYAMDENGNPFSPAWTTINLKGIINIHENMSISFGLENITDVRYRSYSSGVAAPGRNFILSLIGNF